MHCVNAKLNIRDVKMPSDSNKVKKFQHAIRFLATVVFARDDDFVKTFDAARINAVTGSFESIEWQFMFTGPIFAANATAETRESSDMCHSSSTR